jgi:hypothetical protein
MPSSVAQLIHNISTVTPERRDVDCQVTQVNECGSLPLVGGAVTGLTDAEGRKN